MFIVWALTGQLRERHKNTVPRLVSRLNYSICLGHAQGGSDFSSWQRSNAIPVLAGLAAIAVPPSDLLGLWRKLASGYLRGGRKGCRWRGIQIVYPAADFEQRTGRRPLGSPLVSPAQSAAQVAAIRNNERRGSC